MIAVMHSLLQVDCIVIMSAAMLFCLMKVSFKKFNALTPFVQVVMNICFPSNTSQKRNFCRKDFNRLLRFEFINPKAEFQQVKEWRWLSL